MVWTHVDGVLNNQPHVCCGCYGFGPRGVSKCDERPAATLFPIAEERRLLHVGMTRATT